MPDDKDERNVELELRHDFSAYAMKQNDFRKGRTIAEGYGGTNVDITDFKNGKYKVTYQTNQTQGFPWPAVTKVGIGLNEQEREKFVKFIYDNRDGIKRALAKYKDDKEKAAAALKKMFDERPMTPDERKQPEPTPEPPIDWEAKYKAEVEKNDALRGESDDLRAQLEALKLQLTEQQRASNANIAALQNENRRLVAENQKLANQNKGLNGRIQQQEQQIAGLKKEGEEKDNQIAGLNEQHINDQKTINGLNQQHENDQNTINSLNEQHTNDQNTINNLNQQNQQHTGPITINFTVVNNNIGNRFHFVSPQKATEFSQVPGRATIVTPTAERPNLGDNIPGGGANDEQGDNGPGGGANGEIGGNGPGGGANDEIGGNGPGGGANDEIGGNGPGGGANDEIGGNGPGGEQQLDYSDAFNLDYFNVDDNSGPGGGANGEQGSNGLGGEQQLDYSDAFNLDYFNVDDNSSLGGGANGEQGENTEPTTPTGPTTPTQPTQPAPTMPINQITITQNNNNRNQSEFGSQTNDERIPPDTNSHARTDNGVRSDLKTENLEQDRANKQAVSKIGGVKNLLPDKQNEFLDKLGDKGYKITRTKDGKVDIGIPAGKSITDLNKDIDSVANEIGVNLDRIKQKASLEIDDAGDKVGNIDKNNITAAEYNKNVKFASKYATTQDQRQKIVDNVDHNLFNQGESDRAQQKHTAPQQTQNNLDRAGEHMSVGKGIEVANKTHGLPESKGIIAGKREQINNAQNAFNQNQQKESKTKTNNEQIL